MSTHDKITAAATKNEQILKALAETDYASSALQQLSTYLADLQSQLSQTDDSIKKLTAKRTSELKDHAKYQNSTVRRFAYRLSGKKEEFEAKAEKEEREYFEAVQEEYKAKVRRETLAHDLDKAMGKKSQLEAVTKRHVELQAELDELYNSIFGGPTPEFAEEDTKEDAVTQAKATYDQVHWRLKSEEQVVALLADAQVIMARVLGDMQIALQYSNRDVWGFGGSFADIAERNALSQAAAGASQVEMLLSQAQRIQPAVEAIGPMRVAQGNLMSDFLFDNIFSDLAFHGKIEKSNAEIQQAALNLRRQLDVARARENQCRKDAAQAAEHLEASRRELQQVREDAFKRVCSK
jgi:hypothetical protein